MHYIIRLPGSFIKETRILFTLLLFLSYIVFTYICLSLYFFPLYRYLSVSHYLFLTVLLCLFVFISLSHFLPLFILLYLCAFYHNIFSIFTIARVNKLRLWVGVPLGRVIICYVREAAKKVSLVVGLLIGEGGNGRTFLKLKKMLKKIKLEGGEGEGLSGLNTKKKCGFL